MAQTTLEERVATLESEITALKSPLAKQRRQKDWRRTLGMFGDDEVMKRIFDAALAYREADRTRARRKYAKRQRTKK
jgi:uncharacterized small protein (DUF1192 family)